jgi:lipoyl-dependent peroxiredoxin
MKRGAIMARRTSEAQWEGTLKDGKGRFWTESGEVSGVYSFSTRFEDREGSNPEELIGAALASCFSMKFAGDLGAADYDPESVRTVATVRLDKGESGFAITGVDLDTEARVPGIDPAEFEKIARAAKDSCPVSGALAAIPITLRARLSD